MPNSSLLGIDHTSPPFDRLKHIERLAPERAGGRSRKHARNQLYVAREKHNPVGVLIKVTSKPGLIYERDLRNEISTLSTINQELPHSRYFPDIHDHGRLSDGRLYLITSLFDEFPLATTIGEERDPGHLVTHLRITIEIARALTEIHRLDIFHVDLNPMNVLYRATNDRPVIRIVDFESSHERARHSKGEFYSPPTTPGYTAPEVSHQAPDARADLFSLGALLYTMLAGSRWTDGDDVTARIQSDTELDTELQDALLVAVDPVPDHRYPSVLEFVEALRAYLERIWPGRTW